MQRLLEEKQEEYLTVQFGGKYPGCWTMYCHITVFARLKSLGLIKEK